MVKFLSVIFALYVLLLPFIPCTEIDECNGSNKALISQTAGDHKGKPHEKEACSPFCSCACCGQFFVPNCQLNKIVITRPAVKQQHFFYDNRALPSEYAANIWQPPKIS